ncbi:hypothetical protein VJY32_00055 [Ignavibacteria bacterium 4148-Me]|uniref:hypothetical protein n=1 Tax=Rosettibacter primus TaxID=3111523 RepID=UPI00336C1535
MLINKNFDLLEYLFINNFLSEEEARQALIEEGVNIEEIDSKVQQFLQKLNARESIIKGKLKKAEFEKNLEEFKMSDKISENENISYSLAARKGEANQKDNGDEKLFDFIKKKESGKK